MKKFFSLPRLRSRNTPVRSESERAATSSPVAFDHPPSLNSFASRRNKKRTLSLEPTKEEDETSFDSIEVQDLETSRQKLQLFDPHDLDEITEETCDESTTPSSIASLETSRTERKKRRRSWAGFNNIKKHFKDLVSNFNHDPADDLMNDSVSFIF